VRELKNAVERLALLCESDDVDVEVLEQLLGPAHTRGAGSLERLAKALLALDTGEASKLDAMTKASVEQALAQAGGNKTAAARLLGVHRKTFERLLRAEPDAD
jgi:DNA-binding NtrC family response regulator